MINPLRVPVQSISPFMVLSKILLEVVELSDLNSAVFYRVIGSPSEPRYYIAEETPAERSMIPRFQKMKIFWKIQKMP